MELNDLVKLLRPAKVVGRKDGVVKGVAYDSRLVQEGYLFVAIPGGELNGLDFIDEALSKGALAVVAESEIQLPTTASFIQVKDARVALAQIACAFHRDPSSLLEVVGITGTNGKTTISYLVRCLLEADNRSTGLIGTVENCIGERVIPASRTTPEAPELQAMLDQMRAANCRSAVMEVSSHALDQHRVDGIDFDVSVFTNLTQDHLDYHEDFENYFAAKSRLFQNGRTGKSVINIDDEYGRRLLEDPAVQGELISYGMHPDAMVCAEDVRLDATGSTFMVRSPWGSSDMHLQLLGRFNVSNALAAIAAGCAMGVNFARIVDALEQVVSVPGRLERIEAPGGQVFVDYAHTHDALENVLHTLREITAGRLLVVFGCGGDRDREKRAKMAAVAEELADLSIVTSDNPRRENPMDIITDILSGFKHEASRLVEVDRATAIATGIDQLQEGDILLIAGKGHENYQEFANSVIPFDDREVALNYICQRNR
jgi:UDP-N-acetylmuramoyl-L-alanyl-D-glutamate--2,6-diaminopimelate ligase